MANILIIDDDQMFCDFLSRRINRMGHTSLFTLTLEQGLTMARAREFDLILLDVQLPDGNGIQAIPQFKELEYTPEIIIITGSGNQDGAELAIDWGAWDYIEKPTSIKAITLPLTRALEFRKEKSRTREPELDRTGILGSSRALNACLEQLGRAAPLDVPVLVQGETGTGKELLARAIHRNSPRANHSFIVVDCAAIPESLAEEILFGHEKGVFTGADTPRAGLIEQAHKGTLFLDEIGELPLSIQKKFLRVLQEKKFRSIGSKSEKACDFRLISATHRPLEKMVSAQTFREDLLYRIQAVTLVSPPLRNRGGDISELAMHYVTSRCQELDISVKGFSPDFFDVLEQSPWPGNVRELFNTLNSALAAAGKHSILYPQHLPVNLRKLAVKAGLAPAAQDSVIQETVLDISGEISVMPYKTFREALLIAGENRYFLNICEQSEGDVKKACLLTGLSQSRLYFFLNKHGLSLMDYKSR